MSTQCKSILFFIESGGPGGAEQVVLALAKGAITRGYQVAVVTLRTGWLTETLDSIGIPHIHLKSETGLDFGLPFRLAQLCREQKASVLHSHLLDSTFYAALAARIAGVGHIGTEHGDVHHTSLKKFARVKLGILRLLKTRVSAVSHFTAKRLIELGLSPTQVTCIGNPIPSTERSIEIRSTLRESLGISEESTDHWLWLHVANHRPVKDQATLLRGFAKSLSQVDRKQTLALIGDGPERANLETLCAELDIASHVSFLGFRDDVADWLIAGDGFILSSKSEALPMSLLEAAQAGIVLISSNVGGVGDIIKDKETGLLFPSGDTDALANAIVFALTETAQQKEIAHAGQMHVAEKFSVDFVLDCFESEYQRIASR